MAVGAKLGRAGVHMHGLDGAINGLAVAVHDPHVAQLQVGDVAVFQVDDLVGGAGQRQCVRCQKVLAITASDHQR